MITFQDLEAKIKFHKETEHIKNLIELGKFEIDTWEEGSTEKTLVLKFMIRKKDRKSIETTSFPRSLKTYIKENIKSKCTDSIFCIIEKSYLDVINDCKKYVGLNPGMKTRVDELIKRKLKK